MPTKDSSPGLLARVGQSARQFFTRNVKVANEITTADSFTFDGGTTISSLLGSGRRMARSRAQIYEKWSYMEGDPIISAALMLLVTSALGGDEDSGDSVLIEKTPAAQKDKRLARIVDEMQNDLSAMFNKVAFQMAYNGTAFGDSYARIYADKSGLRHLYTDELVRPPIVQPYEKGGKTVGCIIYSGEKMLQRMDISQIARLQMPRVLYVPQMSVVEKSFRMALAENDIDNLPILPASVGGSFLYQAEEPYDNLSASLLGLVGQRWIDSIDERMVGVNLESMTTEQQSRFLQSVANMLKISKQRAEYAVKSGQPMLERITHILPMFNEKQLTTLNKDNGSARGATISVEDIMVHARLLAGSMGVDLSMIGFADQLNGGFGDGGGFRLSAQAAERARVIRTATGGFFDNLIDIHTYNRYGMVFAPSQRPWQIRFAGSISALEAEQQNTRRDAQDSASHLVDVMARIRELRPTRAVAVHFLTKQCRLDEDEAGMYADMCLQPPDDPAGAIGRAQPEDDDGAV